MYEKLSTKVLFDSPYTFWLSAVHFSLEAGGNAASAVDGKLCAVVRDSHAYDRYERQCDHGSAWQLLSENADSQFTVVPFQPAL